MKGDLVSHNHSSTNAKANSTEPASKDDSDRLVVEEHHGDGSLVEGEEDTVIY